MRQGRRLLIHPESSLDEQEIGLAYRCFTLFEIIDAREEM